MFASNFVLDGINIVSKEKLLKADETKIANLLQQLKDDYKKDIDKIQEKDFDIFGNISQDKTKIKRRILWQIKILLEYCYECKFLNLCLFFVVKTLLASDSAHVYGCNFKVGCYFF